MESYRQRLSALYDSFDFAQAFNFLRCLKRAENRCYELISIEEELSLKLHYELIDWYSDLYISLEEGPASDVQCLYNLVLSHLSDCHPFFREDFECMLIDCFSLWCDLQHGG